MISFYKKYYKTVLDIALIVLTVYLIMYLFSWVYNIASPIIIAFLIYLIIEPIAMFFHRRKLKKAIASALASLFFALGVVGITVGLGVILTVQVSNLLEHIPYYFQLLQQQITEKTLMYKDFFNALSPDISERINEYAGVAAQKASQVFQGLFTSIFSVVTSFSTFIVNFVIAIILAYFLSVESEQWKRIAQNKTPKTFKKAFYFLKDNVLVAIGAYIKALLILISITFSLVFISLVILGVNNAFTIALLSAILDLLPVVGVPVIFIPWIIYCFIVGDTKLAISLAVVLVVVMLVRQILEPKITGDRLGVSAFTMLSFIIISLSLFGVAGLILSPILIILIKALYEQGYLKRWIRLPEEEYDEVKEV